MTASIGPNGEAFVMERRRLRGIFLETLELNDFPLDVQVSSCSSSVFGFVRQFRDYVSEHKIATLTK